MESEQATPHGHSSKFRESSRIRQIPEEGQKTYRPKCCGNNNKDEDNSLKTLKDKNHQASSQKFRQLNDFYYKNALEMSFTLKNALEMIFTIKMH